MVKIKVKVYVGDRLKKILHIHDLGYVAMSHTSGLPKTVLSSAVQNEPQTSALNSGTQTKASVYSKYKFEETVEKTRVTLAEHDAHQKRLRNLRKQLDHVNETAWKFHPVDTFIGQ